MPFKSLLEKPVSGSSLAFMRFAVGLLMVLEAYTLCHPSQSTFGEIPLQVFYTSPAIHITFPYPAFDWLPLVPATWIYVIVGVLAVAGLMMAVGFCYRFAAAAVFLSWGYLYAVEATRTYWMSYYYVELLLTFLLIWMPAARKYSVDAWIARGKYDPGTVPFWTIFLLRSQLVITYFYAGVAKLNSDWLVNAEPVRYFLYKARLLSTLGAHLTKEHLQLLKSFLQSDGMAYFLSYAGAVFDLSVGFLLLARRTRILGLILMFMFHATNHFVLFEDLEWFPLVGAVTALIFLDPDWPDRLWNWLRHPRVAKPDMAWLGAGGVLIPGLGAALGWKLAPSAPPTTKGAYPVRKWVAPFVVTWLVWQLLMPLRHYLIPGDARFTWEGLSFSWRLKAEVYRSSPCSVTLEDPEILSKASNGQTRINWARWNGERVIYRTVSPSPTLWQRLPEVVVVLEPETGERIIYNPCSGVNGWRPEAECRQRIQEIWQELYGRQPQAVLRTFPFTTVLGSYANALQSKGESPGDMRDPSFAMKLMKKHGRQGDGQMLAPLRRATPFGTDLEASPQVPFLVIDDEALYHPRETNVVKIDRRAWVSSTCTRLANSSVQVETNLAQDPLVVYAMDIHVATKDLLPQAFICDSADHPQEPPTISWNYLKELSMSEGMHVSTQPFFLRRYARHVAALWQKEHGTRPMVHVDTQVSLNGRPFQRLVNPDADLASVPMNWFGHNWWIRDLETPHIQTDGLVPRTAGP